MRSNNAEVKISRILEQVGCTIGGEADWDPQVKDSRTFDLIAKTGTLGAGEAYMNGYWDCKRLDILSEKVGAPSSQIKRQGGLFLARVILLNQIINRQSTHKATANAEHHYNIGNELYEAMLGETMAYSCAYWQYGSETKADNLDDAQLAKFDLICRKLKLKSGMKLLDIGCGWGGLLRYATDKYDVEAVGITPATNQADYIKAKAPEIDIRVTDWRQIENEKFDRVVSVGMFEHVGRKNYRDFFGKTRELLATNGISLLHTIGAPKTRYFEDPWIEKYIFPGGYIPSRKLIENKSRRSIDIIDWQDLGPNYDHTLMAWNANFQAAWPELATVMDEKGNQKYDSRFKRMWEYYLQMAAGSFRNGTNRLFQAVLGDQNIASDYLPER